MGRSGDSYNTAVLVQQMSSKNFIEEGTALPHCH